MVELLLQGAVRTVFKPKFPTLENDDDDDACGIKASDISQQLSVRGADYAVQHSKSAHEAHFLGR